MTRNNDRTVILVLLVVFILASGFSACTVGPVGIFASIAQEKDINANRTLAFDGTSPEFVGKLGSTYYTIIGNTVWFRPVTGGPWNKLTTLPSGVSTGTASSATIAGANLFVTFGLIGDSAQKVWRTSDGISWDDTLTNFPSTVKVNKLLSANNEAFAVTRTDTTVDSATETTFSLYYWNGSSFVTAGAAVTDIDGQPTSIAWDGTNYWVTGEEAVYQGPATNFVAVTTDLPADSFGGVSADGATVIFSSTSGKLYTYNGSGVWPSKAFDKSDLPYAFTAPAVLSAGGINYLLVGTTYATGAAPASGYLEFDITGGFNLTTAVISEGSAFADYVNFQISVAENYLSNLTVADEGAGAMRVFALTVGNGLWSNYFNGSVWAGWARE